MCDYYHYIYSCGHEEAPVEHCNVAIARGTLCTAKKCDTERPGYSCEDCVMKDLLTSEIVQDLTAHLGGTLLGQETTEEQPKAGESSK